MSLIRRPFYVRVGRLELFAQGWRRLAGDPLIGCQKSSREGLLTFQLWMPGVHLIVDWKGGPEVGLWVKTD